MKTSLPILCLLCVLISSCGTTNPTVPPSITAVPMKVETSTSTATFTPVPTATISRTQPPTVFPTNTPQAANEPSLVALFGEEESAYHSSLVFSPDGRLIGQAIFSLKLWDARTQKLIRELKYPYPEKYYATKALFSPDGSLIAVTIKNSLAPDGNSTSHLLVWDVSTGELLQDWVQEHAIMSTYNGFDPKPAVYNIPVDAMVFFPSSTKLAYANGNRVEIKSKTPRAEKNFPVGL